MHHVTVAQMKSVRHPKEGPRFALATFVCVGLVVFALILFAAAPFAIPVALIYLGIIAFVVWFVKKIVQAAFIANHAKAGENSFPEIYNAVIECKKIMAFDDQLDVYIVEEGSFNASLMKFFNVRFIVLNSDLVEAFYATGDKRDIMWIIARFIGAMKARQLRFNFASIIISAIEKIAIFNLFILPYVRATQYTGDRIGLLAIKEVEPALRGLYAMMVGKDLYQRVSADSVAEQHQRSIGGFFSFLARIWSSHPHTINRIVDLVDFSRSEQARSLGIIGRMKHPSVFPPKTADDRRRRDEVA